MSARVQSESARRVSDCVTALLREQPFFGSLALRLPIRADASRETVASDGREIRYSPRWIADTDAHFIETAMARVVLACALKHHTRRGERDPERWQRASQLVTHGLLRDAGFTLPPDAEAWDGISVEQAYDRLPEPDPDDGDGDGNSDGNAPSGGGDAGAPDSQPCTGSGCDDDSSGSDNPGDDNTGGSGDSDPQDGDDQGADNGSDAPPSCDPAGTGEVMDAPAGGGQGGAGPSPAEIAEEEQAWDEAMHQAASLAKAQGKLPGAVEEKVRGAHGSTVDWRTLLRRYMTDAAKRDYSWSLPNRRFIDSGLYLPSIRSEGIDTIAVIVDTSGSLPAATLAAFWTELREIATELQPERVILLQVDAAVQDTRPQHVRRRAHVFREVDVEPGDRGLQLGTRLGLEGELAFHRARDAGGEQRLFLGLGKRAECREGLAVVIDGEPVEAETGAVLQHGLARAPRGEVFVVHAHGRPFGGLADPHGTSISFEATESAAAIRNAAEHAARHYPLPVFFEGIAPTEPGGETNVVNEQLDRRAFLDGAVHAEPWRGSARSGGRPSSGRRGRGPGATRSSAPPHPATGDPP